MTRLLLLICVCGLLAQAKVSYRVRLTHSEGGQIVEMSAEQYVVAVLAGESGTFRSDEALCAMAIAARTYAARLKGRHSAEGFDFCATTHCQRAVLRGVTPRLTRAAEETHGLLLWDRTEPAFAVYSKDCGGMSEAADALWPDVTASYLRVHADPFCRRAAQADWEWSARPEEIVRALLASRLRTPQKLEKVSVLQRTESGRARMLELSGAGGERVSMSVGTFRTAIGRVLGWNTLRSAQYQARVVGDHVVFHGHGEGHGVGLCQRGADEMGVEGRSYREILRFYYPGLQVSQLAVDVPWQRSVMDGVSLFSLQPERDRVAVPLLTQALQEARQRTGLPFAGAVELYVYPDLEAFRNATGEPGWVAAHTRGVRIALQPVAVLQAHGALRSTLQHEALHIVIGSAAAPNLPVWFREGLVEYLARSSPASSAFGSEGALLRRQDRAQTAAAYRAAEARVSDVVQRYGLTAVLGWVKAGLDPAVIRSSTSSEQVNSR